MNDALIIVDIQMDYFAGGAMVLPKSERALKNAEVLVNAYRKHKKTIIYIAQQSPEQLGFLVSNTPGAEIHPVLTPHADEVVINKNTPNAFFKTNLNDALQELKITKLTIIGFMAHMCVDSTVRNAKELGYDVTIVPEAIESCEVAGVSAENVKKVFLTALSPFFAREVGLSEIIDQMHS